MPSLSWRSYHRRVSIHRCSEHRRNKVLHRMRSSFQPRSSINKVFWHHHMVGGSGRLCVKLRSHPSGDWKHIGRPLFISHPCFRSLELVPMRSVIISPFLRLSGSIGTTDSGSSVDMPSRVVRLLALPRLPPLACYKSCRDQVLRTLTCHSVLTTKILRRFFVSSADGTFIMRGKY